MTDYEHIVISAERYALGRKTYIVELTVNYILQEIEEHNKDKIINNLQEENGKLKEIIINMASCMFQRDNTLTEAIKSIDKNLKRIARRR